MYNICIELDNALLDVMACLKRLAHSRDQYGAAVKEVGFMWKCTNFFLLMERYTI